MFFFAWGEVWAACGKRKLGKKLMAGNTRLVWPGTLPVCLETLLASAGSSEMKLPK